MSRRRFVWIMSENTSCCPIYGCISQEVAEYFCSGGFLTDVCTLSLTNLMILSFFCFSFFFPYFSMIYAFIDWWKSTATYQKIKHYITWDASNWTNLKYKKNGRSKLHNPTLSNHSSPVLTPDPWPRGYGIHTFWRSTLRHHDYELNSSD